MELPKIEQTTAVVRTERRRIVQKSCKLVQTPQLCEQSNAVTPLLGDRTVVWNCYPRSKDAVLSNGAL